MEVESTNSGPTANLPILKLGEYEMWENGTSVTKMFIHVIVEEKTNKKNDVKARSLLLMALPNEHQLTFNQYPDAKSMFIAIETRFGGNAATKKTQKTLLKQQYENFSATSAESLDSIFNRLQKIVSRLAILVSTASPNVNAASLQVSTANISDNTLYAFMVENPNGFNVLHQDLEQIHEDDLEAMDLKWQLSLLSVRAKKYYQRTSKKIFINANDIVGYNKSKVKCYNYHKLGYFARECRAPRSKEGQFRNQDNPMKQGNNEDKSSKAMLAIDGVGFDWSDMAEEQVQTNMALMAFSDSKVYTDKTCSKICLKNYETLKKQCDDLLVKLNEFEFKETTYKRGLATLEDQIITYKKNEVLFSEETGVLKREVACKEYEINMLKSEFEKVKQEKDGIDFKIEIFDKASKDLDQLLGSQITDKSKKGLGYSAVPPPHPLIYNRPKKLNMSYSGLDEFKEPEFKDWLVMSFASSVVTYTSVYTDSEPGRPVAPSSPDYIPGPEDLQTPSIPQDEDELEEQPLPPVDSPIAESPGYVTESDPKEDLEEYEDDETKDGLVDYPMDRGDDGDDDDGDSSRDDADDEDEDEKEENEEHPSLADFVKRVISVSPVASASAGAEGPIPPKTAEQKLARKNELKAKSTLLLAIIDEHLLKFQACKDAKSLWEAIKNSQEGLDKTYDRFQKLISQLEIHGEVISQKDSNLKLLRSLPSAWNNIALIMRKKSDLDTLSIDDLYNNLKVYESEIKGQTRTLRNQGNRNRDDPRRNAPVDTSTTNALVVQDRIESLEARIVVHENNEAIYEENIAFLKYDVHVKDISIKDLKNQLEEALKEKDDLKLKLENFEESSKNLTKLSNSQISDKDKTGLGYDSQMNESELNNIHMNESEVVHSVFNSRESDVDDSLVNDRFNTVRKTTTSVPETETSIFNTSKDTVEKPKTIRASAFFHWRMDTDNDNDSENTHRQVEYPRKSQSPREIRPVWNNAQRVNHQNKLTHPHPKRNFVPTAVATKSGQVPVNAAKQSSPRAAASISTARPVNIVAPKPKVNDALPTTYSYFKAHSPGFNNVTNVGKSHVVSVDLGNGENAVKSSACWIWRPTGNVIDHTSKDSRSYMLKRFDYVDLQGRLKSIDGGFVAFGGNPKGGKITGKGKIRTGKLDFEDVYFVKELKFNLFSVSQMYDKKNSVLFIETECLVLSPDFKLLDESQVLLKVPRQNNMYSFDLKNIVPSGGLTCLFVKATIDESNLWHRRLDHINFKTMNKLVRGNLVRGLPSKLFENDHTCVSCQKRKQHKASCKTKLNRVLVTKPYNKTPYELLLGRPPSISFMRPFGCPMTILNTLDPLEKFDGNADEGFLVGYSINNKAFMVFNSRTKKLEENLHINFLENKTNVAGSGPEWLFDIDSLIKSMNYEPVTVMEIKLNGDAVLNKC
ncbi:ribonuclease H-like domain-containing protein [Tanacetum coccineum]|uniref:Ribonuclease H-like domain-containing protein n=1 Tax=Tanacetum coccineum TaxID=301880 RepID=A0ABQ4ZKY3_9ASTR